MLQSSLKFMLLLLTLILRVKLAKDQAIILQIKISLQALSILEILILMEMVVEVLHRLVVLDHLVLLEDLILRAVLLEVHLEILP